MLLFAVVFCKVIIFVSYSNIVLGPHKVYDRTLIVPYISTYYLLQKTSKYFGNDQ
jgi:hypothetical protein